MNFDCLLFEGGTMPEQQPSGKSFAAPFAADLRLLSFL
jgi:hypothetical protein